MRKKVSKSAKVRAHFQAYPNATPKEVGAKFKCAMPVVYAIRKEIVNEINQDVRESMAAQATPYKPKPTKETNLLQVGGDHYRNMGVQPWVAMESWMTTEQFVGFLRGNAIKYLARCDVKGKAEDVKKARHYIDKMIEVMGD